MDVIFYVVLGLFACVGFVHVVAWIICSRKRGAWQRTNFRLIPLARDARRIDAQMENCILQIAWGMWSGRDIIFLAAEETEAYVRKKSLGLFGEGCSVYVCLPEDLAATALKLSNLQNPDNSL